VRVPELLLAANSTTRHPFPSWMHTMDAITNLPTTHAPAIAYRLLRYAQKAVRDEWIYSADGIAKR